MNEKAKKIIIGSLIKKQREKKGLTQEKMSALVGIDPTNLSKIERGLSFPSFKNFCSIVEILKIEPNYFLNFVNFEKENNTQNKELIECIKTLSDESQDKLIEFILSLK